MERVMLNVAMVPLMLFGTGCLPPPEQNTQDQQSQLYDTEHAMIYEKSDAISKFVVTGSNADFGRFVALGEATLIAVPEAKLLEEGAGAAVLQAENGDQIVADVTCKVTDTGLDVTFHWRDSVTFSTGSTVDTTGAFVALKPPGLALSSIRGFNDGFGQIICANCCSWVCTTEVCTWTCNITCLPISYMGSCNQSRRPPQPGIQ